MHRHIGILFSILVLAKCQDTNPTVCLDQGACYKGSWLKTTLENTYGSFQGIQYAESPVGSLRFKAPQPFLAGEAVFDVSHESKIICPQPQAFPVGLIGQEDCLVLNVYVPEKALNNPDVKLPVMVWIHGGGLIVGSGTYSDYGPQYFMDKDVVVVSINYRLGVLGYLSLGNEVVPGNAGLKDQVLALQWIQQNIETFGGDPNSVTIFGQSGGSFAVSLLVLSPMTNGLFHRAISQSLSAIAPGWGAITKEHAFTWAELASKNLGCDYHAEDVLTCLQGKDLADVVAQTDLGTGGIVWNAVPDGDFTSDPFLPTEPGKILYSGSFNHDVEIIIGTNKDEGLLFMTPYILDNTLLEDYKNNFDILGPLQLFNIGNASEITSKDIQNAHEIVEFYVGSVENIDSSHIQGLVDMLTDATFLYGTRKTIDYMSSHGVKIFEYIVTYEGEYSFTQAAGIESVLGVCHGDEMIYMWEIGNYTTGWNVGPLNDQDKAVRDMMVSTWTNFATLGDPTPPDSGLSWIPQAPDLEPQYWDISGSVPVMTSNLDIQKRMALWDRVCVEGC